MEVVGYLECSQELATGPYPKPYESNLYIHTMLLQGSTSYKNT